MISIIIPVARGDSSWRPLVLALGELAPDAEVVLSAAEPRPIDLSRKARWLEGRPGRARQLNLGARSATGDVLWFLHADSKVGSRALVALERALRRAPRALHFFDLKFAGDGPPLMRLNAGGAWLRSRLLKIPFGDQGLFLARETFERLGPFDEQARYGEDHLFVWRAHALGVEVRAAGAAIETSARRYARQGWLKGTALTMGLTWKQAAPELLTLLAVRAVEKGRHRP